MRCEQALRRIETYADDELPAWRRFALRRHLVACPSCATRLEEARTLRARIRAEAPRYAAPADLRARILALPAGSHSRAASHPTPEHRWRWVGAGALVGCVLTVVSWLATNAVLDRRANDDLATASVNAHVQATLGNRSTQVASSDQHTVKPWLSARLDYSPPVQDLADAGIELVGARIENLSGHPVATLVYRYREHTIDVFVRPDWLHSRSLEQRTIRGFNVVHATGHDMDWLAVSDAAPEALAPLVSRLAGSGATP